MTVDLIANHEGRARVGDQQVEVSTFVIDTPGAKSECWVTYLGGGGSGFRFDQLPSAEAEKMVAKSKKLGTIRGEVAAVRWSLLPIRDLPTLEIQLKEWSVNGIRQPEPEKPK